MGEWGGGGAGRAPPYTHPPTTPPPPPPPPKKKKNEFHAHPARVFKVQGFEFGGFELWALRGLGPLLGLSRRLLNRV